MGRGKQLPATLCAPRSRLFPGFVPKMSQALTFSATIRNDVNQIQTITVITLLALLTISGAVISDQVLTNQGQPGGGSVLTSVWRGRVWRVRVKSWGDVEHAFRRSIPETYQPAGRGCGFSDRFAGIGRGCLPFTAGAISRRVTIFPD